MKRPKLLVLLFVLGFLSQAHGITVVLKHCLQVSDDTGKAMVRPRGKTEHYAFRFITDTIAKTSIVPSTEFGPLTPKDKAQFILSANQKGIGKWRDTLCFDGKNNSHCLYAIIPVSLSNLSADTLKYINMSCSWLDAFAANIKNVHLSPNNYCYKNGPAVFTVPPFKAVTFYIPVIYFLDAGAGDIFKSKMFKIGMSLYKVVGRNRADIDILSLKLNPETANLIWSNEVEVR
jgi:hypothetical protein